MRYAVVIEKAEGNYSAYVPDLPGCVATGPTVAAVEQEIRDAIRFHVDGLSADGLRFRLRRALQNMSTRERGGVSMIRRKVWRSAFRRP